MKIAVCRPLPHVIILSLALFGFLDVNADDDNHALLHCGPGQRLLEAHGKDQPKESCKPCPPTTYMSSKWHRKPDCLPCTRRKSEKEMIVIPCTNVSNAVMGCAPGYFKRYASTRTQVFTCLKCQNCSSETPPQFVGRPCQGKDNTFCCEEPGMEVVGGVCTHASHTVTVCAPGFFDPNPSPTGEASEHTCRPCMVCSSAKDGAVYEARPCGRSMDTVCCSRPNANTVFNSQTGLYECQNSKPEPKSDSDNQPTESHNTKTGRELTTETLSSAKDHYTKHQQDVKIITVFVVLFVLFFVISIVLGIIVARQNRGICTRRRRSSATPKISQSVRRKNSLLNNIEERVELDGLEFKYQSQFVQSGDSIDTEEV